MFLYKIFLSHLSLNESEFSLKKNITTFNLGFLSVILLLDVIGLP